MMTNTDIAVQALWNLTDNPQAEIGETYDSLVWHADNISSKPTRNVFESEFDRIKAETPMRLLRIERDNRVAVYDWVANSDVVMPQNIKDYRQALRDLPQDIAAGTIPAPTLDANGQLIFNDWPVFVP